MEAEPPPSPYLTPDFGKEDPFEILGKAVRCLPCPRTLGTLCGVAAWGPPQPCLLPALPSRAAGSCSWLVACPVAFELLFHCKQG